VQHARFYTPAYHEITLDELQLVSQTFPLSVSGCALNLVVIVVQSSDVRTSELGNLTGWTSNTATNIENLHVLTDTNAMSEVMLVSGDSLVERLTVGETAEVERLSPTILVQVGTQVVVTEKVLKKALGGIHHHCLLSGQSRVLSLSGLEEEKESVMKSD
jgi:hypothetical protein